MNRRDFCKTVALMSACVALPFAKAGASEARVTVDRKGVVSVISISGKCTIGECGLQLRSVLQEELAAGRCRIVVNLGATTFMDSSALGDLVYCFTSTKKRMGRFALADVSPKVMRVLDVTNLRSVFDIYPTVAAAVDALSK